MGEFKNSHFYDFGIFGRVPEPRNQFFIFGDTKIPKTNQEESLEYFSKVIPLKISKVRTSFVLEILFGDGINIFQKTCNEILVNL